MLLRCAIALHYVLRAHVATVLLLVLMVLTLVMRVALDLLLLMRCGDRTRLFSDLHDRGPPVGSATLRLGHLLLCVLAETSYLI